MTSKLDPTSVRQKFLDLMKVYPDKEESERHKILTEVLGLVESYSPQIHKPEERAQFGEFVSEHLFRRARTVSAKEVRGYVEDVRRIGQVLLKIHQLTGCSIDYYISTEMVGDVSDPRGYIKKFWG